MASLSPLLAGFYERDLLKVKEEIDLYPDEQSIWSLSPGINNSAGTLCLHIAGNLLHFIGATLGNTGYIRERDREFSLRNIPRAELHAQLDQALIDIRRIMPALTDEQLQQNFPLEKHGETVTTAHMLVHLLGHLGYHLGQINYHRRMITTPA